MYLFLVFVLFFSSFSFFFLFLLFHFHGKQLLHSVAVVVFRWYFPYQIIRCQGFFFLSSSECCVSNAIVVGRCGGWLLQKSRLSFFCFFGNVFLFFLFFFLLFVVMFLLHVTVVKNLLTHRWSSHHHSIHLSKRKVTKYFL